MCVAEQVAKVDLGSRMGRKTNAFDKKTTNINVAAAKYEK